MHQTRALGPCELMAASGDLVPQRETLALLNIANVVSVNLAIAINAASIDASAHATAGQLIAAGQF